VELATGGCWKQELSEVRESWELAPNLEGDTDTDWFQDGIPAKAEGWLPWLCTRWIKGCLVSRPTLPGCKLPSLSTFPLHSTRTTLSELRVMGLVWTITSLFSNSCALIRLSRYTLVVLTGILLSGWSRPGWLFTPPPGKLEVLVLGREELLERDHGDMIGLGSCGL
jgi:hypothetical protein